ncbi:MAG: type II secretion system F family protein [Deltaproteobacteria bacterium]|nr:type II secretion system F family protein [Deltaproteobacteria bacterium]
MPLYHYRASDPGGNIVSGTLEAREERLVVLHLQQGGLIPLRISQKEETSGWKRGLGRGRSSRVPLKDIVHFTQELAALLKAGLPLDRSLQALQEVTSRPAMKQILAQVLRDLQGGKSLSESLGRHRAFSSLYVSLVEAGETGGFLDEALDRLGDYLKTVSEFRSYLLTALIYPIILAGVGSLSLILMLLYVVPRFEDFFKEMGQNLYWSTSFLLALSRGFRSYWWAAGLLAALAVLIVVRMVQSPKGQMTLDRFKMTAPLLGDLSRRVAAAFFAKTLGTLLHNGVPMVTSLRVVINSVANRYLAHSLTGVLANVEKGQQLSVLLKKVGMFPELFLQMVAIGEETGHLADMLLSAALSLENDARTAVRRLMALLEPVLILATALVVAFIIVSLMLPILNLYEIQF